GSSYPAGLPGARRSRTPRGRPGRRSPPRSTGMGETGNGAAGTFPRPPWWLILYSRSDVTDGPNAFALDFASLVHGITGSKRKRVFLYTNEQTAHSVALTEGSPSVHFPDLKDAAVAADTLRMLMHQGVTHVAFDTREVTPQLKVWPIEGVIRDLE